MADPIRWDNYRFLATIPGHYPSVKTDVALVAKNGAIGLCITRSIKGATAVHHMIPFILPGGVSPVKMLLDTIYQSLNLVADFPIEDPNNIVYKERFKDAKGFESWEHGGSKPAGKIGRNKENES